VSELVAGLAPLRAVLAAAGDPARARAMAAYQKDQFVFFGVPAPERRLAQAEVMGASKAATSDDLLAFARACWAAPERELQYVAVDVLSRRSRALDAGALPALAELIEARSWWDTVDGLAANVVGDVVRRHPAAAAVMDTWIEGALAPSRGADPGGLWLARAAVLHQLKWGAATDADRLFAYAARHAGHKDFFMRKAIGWALRVYARHDPDAVRLFVASHPVSGLTRREALKHLGG
jgi:3-methyladenine DNA glycosylase AlkD